MSHPVDAAMTWFLSDVLPADYSVTVACSGGADSLALALATLLAAGPARSAAVTIDHGLQAGSAEQARTTAGQLRTMGILDVQVRTVSPGTAGGPEAAARRARYRAMVPGTDRPRAVLLGHTLDDQAETVLLGLARGSGPRSLAGMTAWRRPWGRPLLGVRRADTEDYCRRANLRYFSDPHNADPRYTRVRLRREVLPLMDQVLGGAVAPALARTAQLMQEDLSALDLLAAELFGRATTCGTDLDLGLLAGQPVAIRRRVLRAWASMIGSRALNSDHLIRLDRLAVAFGGSVRLPGGIDAVREGRLLVARRLAAPRASGLRFPAGGSH